MAENSHAEGCHSRERKNMHKSFCTSPPVVILRRKEVQKRTGLSRSSIYNLMKADKTPFPRQIQMSPRTVGWLEADIEAYIQARVRNSTRTMKAGA